MYSNICEGCIFEGRCDGNCELTNPLFLEEQKLNDYHEEHAKFKHFLKEYAPALTEDACTCSKRK